MLPNSIIEKSPETGRPRKKTPEQALNALMRLAARAEKSSGDALRLMISWGIAPADRARILQRLIEERFIDDERYAAAFVREKTALNGWGSYKIRTVLRRKGIAEPLIESALKTIDRTAARDRLNEMLRRRLRSVRAKSPYDLRTKLIRYGISLGYDYETTAEAVGNLISLNEEPCDEFHC